MSVGHGFAGGENGYAVSGVVRSEGLRGRKARKYAGRVVRRMTRSPRPRFRGDFQPIPMSTFLLFPYQDF
jgi:hypothetical protein